MSTENSQALSTGYQLNYYTIQKVLGIGGFGITYLAIDTRDGSEVVIKENLPIAFAARDSTTLHISAHGKKADYEWAINSFINEAHTLGQLDHPNIVKVLRAFKANGTAYFVMPYMGGQSLDVILKEKGPGAGFSEEILTKMLSQLLEALDYLHRKNLLHRDIKPGNILVNDEGVPTLIDFGTARRIVSERTQTAIESHGYTPFEQMQSRGNVGPWSDLYALGGTMYKILTGETPPPSADRIIPDQDPVLPLYAQYHLKYSTQFRASIDQAMRPLVADRWQSAQEWNRNLSALQAHGMQGTTARGANPSNSKMTMIVIILMASFLLIAGGGGAALWMQHRSNVAQLEAQRAETMRLLQEREYEEKIAAEKAEAERIAAEQRAKEKLEEERRLAEEKLATEKRIAAEQAAQQIAAAKLEAERAEAARAEAARVEAARQRELELELARKKAAEADANRLPTDLALGSMGYQSTPSTQSSQAEELYRRAQSTGDSSTAANYYLQAAQLGHAAAQADLSHAYIYGVGVPVNNTEAFRWAQASANQGNALGQNNLGVCYNNGKGVAKNEREAVNWYRRSAAQNNARGQNNLGACYQFGMGTSINISEAVRLYRLSANQGDSAGQRNLGKCYMNGVGMGRNLSEARVWLSRAAAQGDKIAARLLKSL